MHAESSRLSASTHPTVRVFTLGRFQVEVNGAPLRFGRKVQRKPLDLLKLLIAHGGEGVAPGQLAEDLWPDAEGDAAAAALRTTLSRARKLIGAQAIRSDARGLSLDPRVCWSDALALRQRLADPAGGVDPVSVLEETLSLYRGEFLPGDAQPAVLAARAMLRRLLLRRLLELGPRLEQEGRGERALALYRRALETDPTALDVARRLERLIARPSPADAEMTVAVLPFENLSTHREHEHLAEAVRETVVCLLGALPQLTLLERPAAAGRPLDAGAARYAVKGSVRVTGRRLRAGIQVVDARSGRYVWSEQLDQEVGDAGETRDRIAIAVAEVLAEKLAYGEYLGTLLRPNVQVWKSITLARTLIDHHSYRDHLRAKALLARVVEAAPHEPLARSQLASMHVMDYFAGWSPDPGQSLRRGEQALRELQRRYTYDGRGMHALAWACAMRGDYDEALERARRDIERKPDNFFNHAFLGIALLYSGRHAQGLDSLTEAVRVRPQRLHWLHMTRGMAQFCVGRYDEAARDLATILVDEYPLHRDADLLNARMVCVANLAAAGRAAEAREQARATVAAHPSVSARGWSRLFFHSYRVGSPAAQMERLLVASALPV